MSILENEQEFLEAKIATAFRLAKETTAQHEEKITEKGIKRLAKAWLEAKRPLIEMFGGKTRIEKVVESEMELEDARRYVKTFMDKLSQGQFIYKREEYEMQLLKFNNSDFIFDLNGLLNSEDGIKAMQLNTVTEELMENYRFRRMCSNIGLDEKRQKNTKFTKFFLNVLKTGMEKFNLLSNADAMRELEIISQDLSQLINTMKTNKRRQTVTLSCDLEDFLTMSAGASWDSCHQLGKMYSQGCIAYALSPNALVAFVRSDNHEYEKKWRQVVYCDIATGFAVGSRQYPFPNDVATDGARNIWQETFNMWKNGVADNAGFKFTKKAEGLRRNLTTSNNFAYVDILEIGASSDRISGHVWSTWLDGVDKPVIDCCPAEIICLRCGRSHGHALRYEVTCGDCPQEGKLRCRECGEWHEEEKCTYVDYESGVVCPSCLRDEYTYCNECQRWERDSNMVRLHDGRQICESCARLNYVRCNECGDWHERENVQLYQHGRSRKPICQSCIARVGVEPCSCCGQLHKIQKMTRVGGDLVCNRCLHQNYTQCGFCDDYHLRTNVHVVEHEDENVRACQGCRESRGLTGTPLSRERAGEIRETPSEGESEDDSSPIRSFHRPSPVVIAEWETSNGTVHRHDLARVSIPMSAILESRIIEQAGSDASLGVFRLQEEDHSQVQADDSYIFPRAQRLETIPTEDIQVAIQRALERTRVELEPYFATTPPRPID